VETYQLLAEIERTAPVYVPLTCYSAGIWRFCVQQTGPVFDFFVDDYNKEQVLITNIIVDNIEYSKVESIATLVAQSYYYNLEQGIVYIRFPDDNPAWLYRDGAVLYGTFAGFTDGESVVVGGVQYRPGLETVPNMEQSADAYTYDKMKFVSGSCEIANDDGFPQSIPRVLGNEFNFHYGKAGTGVFTHLAQYYIANDSYTFGKAVYQLEDKRKRLSFTVPNEYFTAEDYPFIDDKYAGKVKQDAFGKCRGIAAVCTNGRQMYQSESTGPLLDFYTFRVSNKIQQMDRIEVKMTNGEINGQKIDGWTIIYNRTVQSDCAWTGWKQYVTAGTISQGATSNGTFTLSWPVAKQGGNRENKINDVRCTGVFQNYTTARAILEQLFRQYTNIIWDENRFNFAEINSELAATSEPIALVLDKEIDLFAAIEKLQSGTVKGWQFQVYENKYTARVDNPGRTPWGGTSAAAPVPAYLIDNINEVEIDNDGELYGSSTDIMYNRDHNETDEELAWNHYFDKSKEQQIIDIHRIPKVWKAETLLVDETDAKKKSDALLEDFIDLSPLANGIRLIGDPFFTLRVYDMIWLDLSAKGILINTYNDAIKQEYADFLSGGPARIFHGPQPDFTRKKTIGDREFKGIVRGQIMRVAKDIRSVTVTIDIRIR
jgi:hypothetical protein